MAQPVHERCPFPRRPWKPRERQGPVQCRGVRERKRYIGDSKEVAIIEVHVKEGGLVNADDPVLTLESDKATMDVPSPRSGTVEAILVRVGDRVSAGSPMMRLRADGEDVPSPSPPLPPQQEPSPSVQPAANPELLPSAPRIETSLAAVPAAHLAPAERSQDRPGAYASPGVRRVAREFDIDLSKLTGTGEKGRITKADVLAFLRGPVASPVAVGAGASPAGAGIPEIPEQDFSRFGPVEARPLSRIQRLSGPHLHRAWLNVPHVTQHDEADITEVEVYRKELDAAGKEKGYRVTLLAFLLKASASCLRQFPEFNASLSPGKDAVIYKRYCHVGIAVDTPGGLVVPVLRDIDRKGVIGLSEEIGAISKRARDGKLQAADMQGASFTISSLGGIGGTACTPIVNAPEVAILGVLRSRVSPAWTGTEFRPRLMLPISVSYDHRVIDGALGARFTRQLCHIPGDVRRLVL